MLYRVQIPLAIVIIKESKTWSMWPKMFVKEIIHTSDGYTI